MLSRLALLGCHLQEERANRSNQSACWILRSLESKIDPNIIQSHYLSWRDQRETQATAWTPTIVPYLTSTIRNTSTALCLRSLLPRDFTKILQASSFPWWDLNKVLPKRQSTSLRHLLCYYTQMKQQEQIFLSSNSQCWMKKARRSNWSQKLKASSRPTTGRTH